METPGKYTYTENFDDGIMTEYEEANPLTWQQDLGSVKYIPPHDGSTANGTMMNNGIKLNDKNVNHKPHRNHRLVTTAWSRRKSRRKPWIVILAIASTFLLLLVAALIVSLYFKLIEHPKTDIEYRDTTATEPTISSTTTTYATTAVLNFTSSSTTGDLTTIWPTTDPSASHVITSKSTTIQLPTEPVLVTTQSLTTRITEYATTTTLRPTTTDVTTQYGEFTTIVEKTPTNLPIFYMSGPFTYQEAIEACDREEAKLALKGDMDKAFKEGYNRCSFGWLRDMHVAMIIQQDYASMDCEKGSVGAIYKPPREPNNKYSGAYCVKGNHDDPDIKSLAVGSNANKTVNWWVTNDPADVYNLRHTLMIAKSNNDVTSYPLMSSLKSIYTCCNAFNITHKNLDGSPTAYVKQRYTVEYLKTLIEMYRREFSPVKVLTHVTAKYETMMIYGAATTSRFDIISSLVNKAKKP